LVNPKAEAAIAWYMSRLGQPVYTGQCELAVENAYGTESVYATAATDWYDQPVKHSDWINAPRGALVFWNTSARGHVAISLGDGRVVSTSVGDHIGIVPTGYFQNPLGWTDSPFG
jgi:cell wall-associated NlpC family hydrolase